ncbi:MAG: hypothetical protein RLZZ262_1591, partial [Bacteroidota bacterium]
AGSAVSGVGTTVVTLTATDAAGNAASCTFNVNRVDNTPPSITCPAAQTLALNSSCNATLGDYRSLATKSDNCSGAANITITQSPAVGSPVSGVGTTVVTLTATDASNNSASCTFNVNRVDNTPPSITCPTAQTLSLNSSCTATLGDYRSLATKSDNCSAAANIIITQSPAVGTTVSGVGTTVVTLTATDEANNTSSCTFNVSRVDNTPPTFLCPENQTLELNEECNYIIPDYTTLIDPSDNCTVSSDIQIEQTPGAGTVIIGSASTTIIISVIDFSNNISTCSFIVQPIDLAPPTLGCIDTQTLELGANCTATLPDYTGAITVSNSCSDIDNIVFVQSPPIGTIISGVESVDVIITATKPSGATSSCSFLVSTIDLIAPYLECPTENIQINSDENCQFIFPDMHDYIVAFDNCVSDSEGLFYEQSINPGTVYDMAGIYPIEIAVGDGTGNMQGCTVQVEFIQTNELNLVCPDSVSLLLNEDCSYTLGNYIDQGVVNLPCGGNDEIIWSQSPEPGTVAQIDDFSSFILSAESENFGIASCEVAIHAEANLALYVQCPNDLILYSSETCDAIVPDFGNQLVITNSCLPDNAWTYEQSPAPGLLISDDQNVIVDVFYLDQHFGCTNYISFLDSLAPTIVCPDTIFSAQVIDCENLVPEVIGAYAAMDNCTPSASLTWSQFPAAGSIMSDDGIVLITVFDASGNSTFCNASIAFVELENPTLFCPTVATLSLNESCTYIVGDVIAEATLGGGCAEPITWTQEPAPNSTWLGDHSDIALYVVLDNDQTLQCTVAVELPITTAEIICPTNVLQPFTAACSNQFSNFISEVSVDYNCTDANMYSIEQSPSAQDVFTDTSIESVTFTLTTNEGITSTCSSSITYSEILDYTIECPETWSIDASNTCTFNMPLIEGVVLNSCGVVVETISNINYNVGELYSIYEYVTIDLVSETQPNRSCTVNLQYDVAIPEFTCPNDTLITVQGSSYVIGDMRPWINIESCDGIGWTNIQSPEANTTLYDNTTVTMSYVSSNGLSQVCTFDIVFDWINNPLQVICPDTIEVPMSVGCGIYDIDIINQINTIPVITESAYTWNFQNNESYYLNAVQFYIVVSSIDDGSAGCNVVFQPVDTQMPFILAFEETIDLALDNNCQYVVPDLSNGIYATDNCSFQITQNPISGTVINENSIVEIVITDGAGLSASTSISLNLLSNDLSPLPQLDDMTLYIDPINCNAEYNWIELLNAQPGCSQMTISTTLPYSSTYAVGQYNLGYFGVNEQGQSGDTSYFQLTVEDVIGPIIQPIPNDMIHLCSANETWDLPMMSDCSSYTYSITNSPLMEGENPMTLIATDMYNNSSTYSFTIIIPSIEWPAIMTTTNYCENAEPVSLPSENFDSIIWFVNDENIGLELDPAQLGPGQYSLDGEAIIEGCPADTTITILVMALPTSKGLLSNYHVCGDSLTFYWATDATTIQWSNDENSNVSYTSDAVTIVMGSYTNHLFEVTYSHGECEAVSTFEVLNDEPIGLVDAGEDQVVAFGLDAQMQGTTTSDNYVWTSDNIGIIIDQIDDLNANIEVPIAGAYDMILTASNGICVASDTTTVSFTGLVVPNTITPNGDHINDNFIIPGDQVATVWLRIVNRWGQVVYEHHNYMNDWSGQNNNGELLPPDTYFYEFKVAEITETGFIQIQ